MRVGLPIWEGDRCGSRCATTVARACICMGDLVLNAGAVCAQQTRRRLIFSRGGAARVESASGAREAD